MDSPLPNQNKYVGVCQFDREYLIRSQQVYSVLPIPEHVGFCVLLPSPPELGQSVQIPKHQPLALLKRSPSQLREYGYLNAFRDLCGNIPLNHQCRNDWQKLELPLRLLQQ